MAELNDLVVTGSTRLVGDVNATGNVESEGTIKGAVVVIPVNPTTKPTEDGAIWIETT